MDDGADRFNDETLSAWVDGELDDSTRQRVDAWLHDHPDAQQRVRQWAADRTLLRGLDDAVLDEAVPERLLATVWKGARDLPPQSQEQAQRQEQAQQQAQAQERDQDQPAQPVQRHNLPRWALAASAAGLLLLGALAGGGGVWQWQQQRMAQLQIKLAAGTAQGWVQRAALAHSVYVPEPRHAVEVKAQEEHLARWLTRRIDVPVKLFDLRALGFELVGGRLLPDGPGKSAQLMYQDARGLRVTVYLRRPERGTDAAFRYEQQGELGMFYWVEEGCGYALVGALPKATLLALADSIYHQQPAAGAASAARPG